MGKAQADLSVPLRAVDREAGAFAREHVARGLEGLLAHDVGRGVAGDMRGDADARVRPERVRGGQGFGREDIEARTLELPPFEGGGEVRFVQMLAPADLDQPAAGGDLVEQRAGKDAMGFRRQRQDVDEDVCPACSLADRAFAGAIGDALDRATETEKPRTASARVTAAPIEP